MVLNSLFFMLFIPNNFICSESSYWDDRLVKTYIHHSELQRRWAMAFIAPFIKTLKGDETILDIGCGDGKITADISRFVPHGSVTGIDPSLPMIEWAKKQYHPLEYPNVTFELGSFLEPNRDDHYDVIVSFCALQHSSDQQKALATLDQLLKTAGTLLLLVPTRNNPAWNAARSAVQAKPPWEKYWETIPARSAFSAQQYKEFLHAAGLSLIRIETIHTMDPFIDKDEIIQWLCGTFAPHVPFDQMHTFYSDWIEEYRRQAPDAFQPNGVIYAKLGYIALVAKKQ